MTMPAHPEQQPATTSNEVVPAAPAAAEVAVATDTTPTTTPSEASPVKIRSPWGAWLLPMVTFGIYYLVWYVKVNKEIARLSNNTIHVGTFGLWLSQCVPIAAWISLANTSKRLTAIQQARGLQPTTTGGMMILSSIWVGSQVRYLQRRLNALYRAELGL